MSAARPYAVSVLDVSRRPGETRPLELDVVVPERIGNFVIGVPAGATLELDGRMESLHDGVLVTATVRGELEGECVRCLTPVSQPFEVDIQELFAYTPDEAFDYLVQNDVIDLEQVVLDSVVPALPFQPVCAEDCQGLCIQCGVRLLEHPGHEHEPQIDARWAALAQLAVADADDESAADPKTDRTS